MTLALGFEVLLAVLLGVTVFFCWRLDRRLNALRTGQNNMRDAVHDLIKATDQAQACIVGLRETAGQSSLELDERINQAEKLSADLQRLGQQARLHTPARTKFASTTPKRAGLMDRLREAG
jgi:Domain of unknown function (DUF6468)